MIRILFLSSSTRTLFSSGLVSSQNSLIEVTSARLTHIFTKEAHLPLLRKEKRKGRIIARNKRILRLRRKNKRSCVALAIVHSRLCHRRSLVSSKRLVLLRGGGGGEIQECAATRQELIFHHFSYSCNRSRYIDRRWNSKGKLENVNKIYLVAIVPIS